jgi:hypothetical protein
MTLEELQKTLEGLQAKVETENEQRLLNYMCNRYDDILEVFPER